MPHLKFRNINDCFRTVVWDIHEGNLATVERVSRYGECLEVEEPVTISYSHPLERCLFNAARDVNPFANVYESLWMIAGRNDVAPLAYYTPRFAEFSDDGKTVPDAYGRRWRHWQVPNADAWEEVDQLALLASHLKTKPESRRAVLEMWDPNWDLLSIDDSKAVCCNTHCYFLVRQGKCRTCNGQNSQFCSACMGEPHDRPRYLDLTVCNRSNDFVWGLAGSNYVTFSVLLEYMAARLGLDVGTYHQVTNNLHVYTNNWKPEEWLADLTQEWAYYRDSNHRFPLVKDPAVFDKEVAEFVEQHQRDALAGEYKEPFLARVAQPMCIAFHHYKRNNLVAALDVAAGIAADDWRVACVTWLQRRVTKRAAKKATKEGA